MNNETVYELKQEIAASSPEEAITLAKILLENPGDYDWFLKVVRAPVINIPDLKVYGG